MKVQIEIEPRVFIKVLIEIRVSEESGWDIT